MIVRLNTHTIQYNFISDVFVNKRKRKKRKVSEAKGKEKKKSS
jgi:hypothetical protein